MSGRRWEIGLFFLWLLAVAGAGYWVWRERHPPPGPYELVALRLNESDRGFCDRQSAPTRLALARLVDQMRPRIHGLWKGKQEFPEFKMEQVGPVFLRIGEKKDEKAGYDSSTWSWEEAAAIYYRTQADPEASETRQRWRDLDVSVRYLLERDIGRILRGQKFLPPSATEHRFQPQDAVSRVGKSTYVVRLDAGEFRGAEKKLERIFESAWSSKGRRVRIEWVRGNHQAYRMRANFRSSRSYVSHDAREMVIANFAFTRTMAHELGHILGFADHYYSVWNGRNCYYTQESRLTDLMSNSQEGRVTEEHWRLLDRAYPWKALARKKPFNYFFKEER